MPATKNSKGTVLYKLLFQYATLNKTDLNFFYLFKK